LLKEQHPFGGAGGFACDCEAGRIYTCSTITSCQQTVHLTNAARSHYNALTVAGTKRMSNGLEFSNEGGDTLTEPSDPNPSGSGRADSVLETPLYPVTQSSVQWLNQAAFAAPANNITRFGTEPVAAALLARNTSRVAIVPHSRFKREDAPQVRPFGRQCPEHPNYSRTGLTLNSSTF
jgi:hypothetical protein